MFRSIYFILFLVTLSCSEPLLFDNLQKCRFEDSKCLRQLCETLMHNLADNGMPSLGISKLDPMPLINQTVSVMGIMDITMVDGFAEGMRSCKLESFDTNMDTKITKFDIFCDVFTVQGAYSIKTSPLINKIFGNPIAGEGNGSVVMEKLLMNFTNPFDVKMKDDGEIYLVPDFENAEYFYEMEKATFKANNITLGILQIAPSVTSFLNRHWDYVIESFGKLFSDKGINLSHDNAKVFFDTMPAKHFIMDDLTQYMKL